MKVAVMQPYFFPYIGYFELINSVDVFVFLTNVQYIRRGWINRNRIKSHNEEFQYLTVPIEQCPQHTLIKDVKIHKSDWHKKHLATLTHVYGKKAEEHIVYQKYSECQTTNLSDLLKANIKTCCEHLGIKTKFLESTNFIDSKNPTQRIVQICEALNASEYINATNGRHLYSQEDFKDIKLTFMEPTNHQNKLSILDLCLGSGIKNL
jgi:hypothetical protein